MKTERQQLEENTERQYALERFEEVAKYIDGLYFKATKAYEASKRNFRLELATFALWVGTLIIGANPTLQNLAWILWIVVLVRSWLFLYPKIVYYGAKIEAAIEVLQILGFTDQNKTNKRKRRLRLKFKHPFAGVKEAWERAKRKARKEAYA